MDVSIVILTKNAGENLILLLQRIVLQKFDRSFEVLLVDSGSTDDTLRVAQSFPVKTIEISPQQFRHGRTRNLGAELSIGRILVYVTQDALPLDDNWLQKLTDNLEEPEVAMVVGRQIPWQSTKPPEKFFYFYYFPQHKIMVRPGASDYYRDNVFISNVNSAIRRDVWQQFRFSESILMTEDKEFASRILSAGWSIVYEPDAAVFHAHDFSLWSSFRRSVGYGISLRQGAKGLPKSHRWFAKRLLGYVTEEIKYLYTIGCLKWLPYCIMYDMSKYLGAFLGKFGLVWPSWRQ